VKRVPVQQLLRLGPQIRSIDQRPVGRGDRLQLEAGDVSDADQGEFERTRGGGMHGSGSRDSTAEADAGTVRTPWCPGADLRRKAGLIRGPHTGSVYGSILHA